MHQLEEKISKNIAQHGLLHDDACVVVALSGGADSVALLAILCALQYRCVVAHCNFHLRGDESNRDEQYAVKIANELGCQCEVVHFDVKAYENEHKVSTEMACRELRYEWFEQLRQKYNAQAIAVAHHRDDDIETMFLNLLRGSGIAGVAAMRWINGYIVRPMLNVSREDIESYLKDKSLDYVLDSTNAECEFKRNKLRNEVLPVLQKAFPGAGDMLMKSLQYLKENREIYNETIGQASKKYKTGNVIRLAEVLESYASPFTLLFEMLSPYGFNAKQVRWMIDAVDASGRVFYSQQWVAVVNRGSIELCEVEKYNHHNEEYEVDLTSNVVAPIELLVEQIDRTQFAPQKNNDVIYLDAKVLEGNPRIVLRHWREGDRLAPFGMNGTKKLSDIFSDAKLSLIEKNKVWILERNGEILWVVGMRASRLFKVNEKTTHILCIKNLQREY